MIQIILAWIGVICLWVLASIITWKLFDLIEDTDYLEFPFILLWWLILIFIIGYWIILPFLNRKKIMKLQKKTSHKRRKTQ